MIKLNYTEQMKNNDKLWEIEKEDRQLMLELYDEIITEAKEKGFTHITETYIANNEAVVEVYENEEEKALCDLGKQDSYNLFGYCKPLIKYIESILNQ